MTKRISALACLLLLLCAGSFIAPKAQARAHNLTASASGHQVTLTYSASSDSTSTAPGTVNVFRGSGSCPASGISGLGFSQISSTAPAAGPFTDSTVGVGNWCYYVTATINGATSTNQSNTVQAVILPLAPSNLAIGSSN